MCDRPWCFYCKTEVLRTFFVPLLHSRKSRKSIKGNVQFKRIKITAVVVKPFALRKRLRVKAPFPVLVMKSGTADLPLNHTVFNSGAVV